MNNKDFVKKKGQKLKALTEEETLEEIKGRKIICTCDEDPRYCEKHVEFW